MPEGFHPPLEEYLEAIHELGEEGIVVIQARLAERLGHSAPAVSEMIRRLRDDGYVNGNGRSLMLTAKGQGLAESVVRKHRLAERLLTDIIGLPWEKAHTEAGRWEHVISDEVEERLVEILGHPTTCPHGNPIPGSGGMEPKVKVLSERWELLRFPMDPKRKPLLQHVLKHAARLLDAMRNPIVTLCFYVPFLNGDPAWPPDDLGFLNIVGEHHYKLCDATGGSEPPV